MKERIEKVASFLAPNFSKELTNKLGQKNEVTIFDIGFFSGNFSIDIVKNLKSLDKNKSFQIYSFDPNSNIKRDQVNNFLKKNKVKWQHFDFALGDKNSVENFSILKPLPASGSSINNILEDTFWLKTRRILFFPFTKTKNLIKTIKVEQKKLDGLNLKLSNLDLLKIDVEGYVLPILKGGVETIKKYSPIIQLEILCRKRDFVNSEKEILDLMIDLKYELVAKKKHYTTHILSDMVCVDYLFEK